MGAHGLNAIGGESMQGRSQQVGLLLGKDVGDDAGVVSRPAALVGNLIAPEPGLTVAVGQRSKGSAGPEGVANITDGPFHAAFGEKRALQTVTRVDYKFSLSRIRSIH